MRQHPGSPVWGGGTLGLLVGLVAGFFVGDTYWHTVLYCVVLGAVCGLATLAIFALPVGLVLGFFVGSSYWLTVLYVVLIAAACGVAWNIVTAVRTARVRPHA